MNRLKHILLVWSILLMAMPCCHAAHVDAHDHDEDVAAHFCAAHECQCHSCDQTDCIEDLTTVAEQRTIFSTWTPSISPQYRTFLPDQKLSVDLRPVRIRYQLISLKTIQLLI